MQFRIIDALKKSPSAPVFEELFWNFDIQFDVVAIKILDEILASFPSIKKVKMVGMVHKKETRRELREKFQARGAALLLSEWEMIAEDLEAEGKEIDADDIFSESDSEEAWDENAESSEGG